MKILHFDIETSPMRGWFWGNNLYEQEILEVDKDTHILGFAYQWNHYGGVEWVGQPDFGTFKRDKENDRGVVTAVWKLFDEADVIVAHNGRQFDIKKMNTRFLLLGMKPPSPYKILDTKTIAKKNFSFPSNKLDEISRQVHDSRKLPHTGKKLWFDCMKGAAEAWKIMEKYCKHDVKLLKSTYDSFLPWIDNHPNRNVYMDMPASCPKCGSAQLKLRGWAYSSTGRRQRYVCNRCGGWCVSSATERMTKVK